MAEELKDLIEKIQEEGVKAAQDRARAIELTAKRRAEDIISKAEKEAKAIIDKAKEEAAKTEEGARASLKQAGRDLLLVLRKEINDLLDRIILLKVRDTLEPKEIAKIIGNLIKEAESKESIIVSLNKDETKSIESGLLSDLGKEAIKGITIKPSEEVGAGFTISYDSGKSYFDFTDTSLAEYIAGRLRPKLAEILKASAKSTK